MRASHVALHVPDLEAAEQFYTAALGLEVVTRESLDAHGGWEQLPPGAGWEDAGRAGVELHMVGLRRDDLIVALFLGLPTTGTLYLVGIAATPEEIAEVRARLPPDTVIEADTESTLMFVDPFGFRWQLSTRGFRGAGEARGDWITL
jgi:catechol 2,3-dioxygenase-like lactoylglutathione lyase family enzyme